jgi:hypothetical protein
MKGRLFYFITAKAYDADRSPAATSSALLPDGTTLPPVSAEGVKVQEVMIGGRLRLVHPEQIMKSTGFLTSVDGGAPIEFGFQPDGSFSIPHVKPGVYNRRIRFVGSTGAVAETNLEPVTVGATSATMTMNLGMDVRMTTPSKGEIQIALKLVEIDDGYYRAHKEKVDAAIEKADLGYFNNLQGVSMLSCPSVSTPPDTKASIDIVREFPYPTQFEPSKLLPNQKVTMAGSGTQTLTLMVPPTPREFVTKDLGVSAEITPTINGAATLAPGKIVLRGLCQKQCGRRERHAELQHERVEFSRAGRRRRAERRMDSRPARRGTARRRQGRSGLRLDEAGRLREADAAFRQRRARALTHDEETAAGVGARLKPMSRTFSAIHTWIGRHLILWKAVVGIVNVRLQNVSRDL